MALLTITEIVADAEADLRAEISDMLSEADPAWRSHLRDCIRGDIATLRELRFEARFFPQRAYDMAA